MPKSSKGALVSGYASYNGTSMATPHVTGAAALYASTRPGSTAAQIKAAILDATVPTPSLQNKTVTGGRLNASGQPDESLFVEDRLHMNRAGYVIWQRAIAPYLK